jgi:hypothetical protein
MAIVNISRSGYLVNPEGLKAKSGTENKVFLLEPRLSIERLARGFISLCWDQVSRSVVP